MVNLSAFATFLLLLPSTQSFPGRTRRLFSYRCLNEATIRGDSVREGTGIRPSLHPLTINTIAEALKRRARQDEEEALVLRVSNASVQPLQVAISAGKLAADAIQKRQASSDADGMALTVAEQQTVAGRVVGVVLRLPELEAALRARCQAASWIAKYGEWNRFGLLPEESMVGVDERTRIDPLFAMNRAECLLALFMDQVEAPELSRKNVTVPDNSKVDFLDTDRLEVLLGLS